jgi:muramoyltetrapeptide carboxypeptidase LdcA involved in peptidoglycan recycling
MAVSNNVVDQYRSPPKKLVRFFASSRDGWKAKCTEAKTRCKRLGNQVRAVEKSRQRWRELAEQQKQRIAELERELAELKRPSP